METLSPCSPNQIPAWQPHWNSGVDHRVSLALILIIFSPGQKNCLKPPPFARVTETHTSDLCSRQQGGYLAIVLKAGAREQEWRHISSVHQPLPPGRGWETRRESCSHPSPGLGRADSKSHGRVWTISVALGMMCCTRVWVGGS